ncbi:MAG: hypothetical protein K0S25_615 [Bacillus sp. (in: firmicutes)]|nr:hypothetical protein [Bacillus sp. (in: firmicutes)]
MRINRKFPLIVSLLLFVQMLFPFIGALAAEVQAPTNLTGYERYPGSVVLDWGAVPSSTAYKVYKIDGDTKTLMTQVTSNKAYLTLKEGTFTLAVSAVVNGQESPLSNPMTIVIDYPEMQAPSNLQSSVARFYDLSLTWTAANYAHYYKIYQVINGTRKLVTTTEKTNIAFNTLPEGHYVYEITTYNSIFGESAQAAHVEVDIVYPDMQAPTNLAYTITNGNDVNLSWTASNYANKYNIYKIEDGLRKLVTSTTNLNVTLPNTPDGKNVFEVTSYSYVFNESQNAAQIEAYVIHPDMLTPGNLKLAITNGNDGTLTWNKVDYSTKYKVYQILDGSRVLLNETTFPQLSLPNMEEGNYIYEVTSYSDRFGESIPARLEQQVVYPDMQSPGGFTGTVLNVDTLYLKWDKAEYADTYKLYQVIDGVRKFVKDINNTYTAISDLQEGHYVYEIASYSDRFGESQQSSRVEADIIYPEIKAPINLQAFVNQEYKSIALSWDEVEYASSYDVYQVINGERILVDTTTNNRTLFRNIPYGEYTYEVIAHSKYGDSVPSDQITADLEPVLEAPTAPKASVEGDNVTLSWDVVNGAESYNIYEEKNGLRVLEQNTTEPSLTLKDQAPGEYTFIIVPVSTSGAESSASSTIIVDVPVFDTTAPETVSNISDMWYRGEAAVELTATDDLSGVAKTFYSVNGSEFVEGTIFVVSKPGVNTVSFYSVDNAGNTEVLKTVELKIDEKPPVTISNVSDSGLWLSGEFTVELSATDDLSGVAKTFYSVNGSEFVEGTTATVNEEGINKVSFYSVDNAGNTEEVKTIEVKIDKTAPATTSNVPSDWSKEAVKVELSATDDLSGVAKTFYSVNGSEFVEGTTVTVNEEGINKVSFYSVDNAGNIEETKTVEVKIDKTAPVVSWNLADEYALGTELPSYTANDALSGIATETVKVNGQEVSGPIKLDQPGTYNIVLTVTDKAGLTATYEKTFVIYIPATIKVNPGVIKGNKGVFTVQATVPQGFSLGQFNLSSAKLNGVSANTGTTGLMQQAKIGQFKFNREDFAWSPGTVVVEFRALINGYLFVGSTTVEVK